jgi:hypothetical protein
MLLPLVENVSLEPWVDLPDHTVHSLPVDLPDHIVHSLPVDLPHHIVHSLPVGTHVQRFLPNPTLTVPLNCPQDLLWITPFAICKHR